MRRGESIEEGGRVAISRRVGGQHTGGLRGDNASCQCRLARQTHQAHEVVRSGDEITGEIDPREPAVTRFAKPTYRFHPAKDFFDSLAHFLTGVISSRTGCASIHGAAAATRVLGDVWRDALGPQAADAFARVVALLSAPSVVGWNPRTRASSINCSNTSRSAVPVAVVT